MVEKPEAPAAPLPELKPFLPPPPRNYVPRAFVEFQQIDWRRLEENDELPAYVQSIIQRRDRRALLAALDRLALDRELRLIRGELRAGEARCTEAIADFDAILDDSDLHALHPRAARARHRCEP